MVDGRNSAREPFAAERIGDAVLALRMIDECHRRCVDYARWSMPRYNTRTATVGWATSSPFAS